MRRLSLIIGSLVALAFALPVSAATVDRYAVPTINMSDESCGFEVDGNVTLNNEYETDFYDNAGNLVKVHITGHVVITYENPANGKSIVENVSGSGHFDFVKGTFVIVGRNGVFSHIYEGRLDLMDGSFTGHVSNEICPALA